jgi:hypothetical protein
MLCVQPEQHNQTLLDRAALLHVDHPCAGTVGQRVHGTCSSAFAPRNEKQLFFYQGGRTLTGWPHTAQSGEPDCRGPELCVRRITHLIMPS